MHYVDLSLKFVLLCHGVSGDIYVFVFLIIFFAIHIRTRASFGRCRYPLIRRTISFSLFA